MGQIQLSGALVAGPPGGSSPCRDRSILNVALGLKGGAGCKSYAVATGMIQLTLANMSYQTLPGVGAAPGVTQADTLYIFAGAPMLIRLTIFQAAGDIVSVFPLDGLLIHEFTASTGYLKLIEALGSGTIEYFASGPL